MNKAFLYIIFLFISINLVLALTVTRDMPTSTGSGKNITVTFNIQDADINSLFTLVETIPSSFTILDWFVDGSEEIPEETMTVANNVYTWTFTPIISNPLISYSVSVPLTATGQHTFSAEWADSSSQRILTITSALCGNGVCDVGETESNCASDCKVEQTTATSTEDGWPFSEEKKKKKGNSFFLIIAILSLGGLGVFGYKKIKKKGIKPSFKFKPSKSMFKSSEKAIESVPIPKGKSKEYVETFASELPSFGGEASGLDLPSLEEHKEEDVKEPEPIPAPPPEPISKPMIKKEEKPVEKKILKKRDELDGLFDNIFSKKENK